MNKKIIVSLTAIVLSVLTLLLATLSFAWIKRDWSPTFYSNNLSIEAAGSLSIMLSDVSGNYDTINLTEKYSVTDYQLTQVSNLTGRSFDFFGVNYDDGVGLERVEHISLGNYSSYSDVAKLNGYVEEDFIIFGNTKATEGDATTYKKYVYISAESYIKCLSETDDDVYKASEAIRISITIHGQKVDVTEQGETYLFSSTGTTHTAVTNATTTTDGVTTYDADGQLIYSGGNTDMINQSILADNTHIYTFDHFTYCEYNESSGQYEIVPGKEPLFTLDDGEKRWITIRIWLEGTDKNCVDDIAEKKMDINVVFRCIDIAQGTSN